MRHEPQDGPATPAPSFFAAIIPRTSPALTCRRWLQTYHGALNRPQEPLFIASYPCLSAVWQGSSLCSRGGFCDTSLRHGAKLTRLSLYMMRSLPVTPGNTVALARQHPITHYPPIPLPCRSGPSMLLTLSLCPLTLIAIPCARHLQMPLRCRPLTSIYSSRTPLPSLM